MWSGSVVIVTVIEDISYSPVGGDKTGWSDVLHKVSDNFQSVEIRLTCRLTQ